MESRLEEALGVLGPIVIWVFFGGVGRGKAPDTLIGTAHKEHRKLFLPTCQYLVFNSSDT